MRYEHTVDIDAPPERIWSVLLDVERWPEWTASMCSVQRVDAGPFAVGCRVRIRQPRLPAVTWRVSEVTDGRAFSWEARSPGMHTVATHRIDARPGGGSIVTLGVRSAGLVAWLLSPWMSGLARDHVRMEAEGLKARSEQPSVG